MKKLAILPLLLALSACGLSQEERLAEAEAALARNDYHTARIHLTEALRKMPGDRKVLELQLRTLLGLGDGYGAQSVLATMFGDEIPSGRFAEMAAEAALLRDAPDSVAALLGDLATPEAERLRALSALMREDRAEAERRFEAAIEAGGSTRAYADFARFRLMGDDLPAAQALLAEADRRDANDIDVLLVGAQIATQRGDLKQALDRYTRAEQLYPGNFAAMLGRAAVLGDLGRLDEMQSVLVSARSHAPNDRNVSYLEARLAQAQEDWRKVRDIVQKREAELGQLDPMRLLYAEALTRLGLGELATAQLTPFVRNQPGNREAARLMAEARLEAGDARGALEGYRRIADNPLARPQELALMARIARKAGSEGTAAEYEKRVQSGAARSIGADLAEADAAMRVEDWARAANAYQRIMAVTDGSNVLVLNNLAYAQLMLGQNRNALANARKALALAPDNPSVLDTAGLIMVRTGTSREEGRRLLSKAAEKAPDNPTIRAHLAEAERPAG